MNETQAYRKFQTSHAGWFRKLHGNRYQSGLPDIIWIDRGVVRFLEFKVSDGPKVPWKKFRLNQHLTMLQMAKHGANVKYVIYIKETGTFHMVDPQQVTEEKGVDLRDLP